MKTFNRPLESDSFSTQEREKKFNRRNDNGHSRSRSGHSRSDSKSISKFFVRNLQTGAKTERIEEFLSKNIKGTQNWSPPRRQPTPSKTQSQKKLTFTKQQLLASQTKQLQNLQTEISKYRKYIYNQSQTLYLTTEQNKKLKEQLSTLKKIITEQQNYSMGLQQKISELGDSLSHKEIMLEYWQKEQPAIKKIKTSIFQTRMMEFQKEKEELNGKIRELEAVVEGLRNNSGLCSVSSAREMSINCGNILDQLTFNEGDQIQKLESQLYKAREQIKKLQISEACTKRKCFKQMQTYKQKKDKEYEDLKKKFSQFLNKYKTSMKKFATYQVKNALQAYGQARESKDVKETREGGGCLESHVSFTLSQDQQHN